MVIHIIKDSNEVVKGWSTTTLENSTELETELDLYTIDIVDNYKLVAGDLVELTDEEKASLISTSDSTLAEKNRADIDYILIMQGL